MELMVPIILLAGQAGSGKSTAAEFIHEKTDATLMAFADPIKEGVHILFGIGDDILYGNSELRNQIIPNSETADFWDNVIFGRLNDRSVSVWLSSIGIKPNVFNGLFEWANSLKYAHQGYGVTTRTLLQSLGTSWGRFNFGNDIWVKNTMDSARKALELHSNLVIITDGRFRNEILHVNMIGGTSILIETDRTSKDSHQSENELVKIPKNWFNYVVHNDLKNMDRFKNQLAEIIRCF